MEAKAYEIFRRRFFERIWSELDQFEEEIESTERLPLDRLMPILEQMGAFGLMVPEKYGGIGLSVTQ